VFLVGTSRSNTLGLFAKNDRFEK